MIRTRVGYSGGTRLNPTYYRLGDHTETIQIDYDPAKLSYEQLLDMFWASHSPARKSWSRQYMAAIFYHNEEQKRLAIKTRDREAERLQQKIYTEILPASEFYRAEAYHQKYYLRQVPELMKEFSSRYPDTGNFISSTAVARVNGYVGGYGTLQVLQNVIDTFGLSPAGTKRLAEMVSALDKNAHHVAEGGAFCPLPRLW